LQACVFQKWAVLDTQESVADPVGSFPHSWSCTVRDWEGQAGMWGCRAKVTGTWWKS